MITIRVPKSICYEMGWTTFSTVGTRKTMPVFKGFMKCMFHYHCYVNWEFRLDKVGAGIYPEEGKKYE